MPHLRPNCECCNKDLPPEATDARICSFECTFCASCADTRLKGHCPNCGGELVARPRMPSDTLAKVGNCKFTFKCHKTWQSLETKVNYKENKRYCSDCAQDVYLVKNDAELESAVSKNYCVAIPENASLNKSLIGWSHTPLLGLIEPFSSHYAEPASLKYRVKWLLFLAIVLVIYFLL